MKDVPASIRALSSTPGGKDKVLLTLAQANEIGRMYDGLKEKEGIDNPMAIAITNFRRMYQVQNGRWIKRKKDNLDEDTYRCSCIKCGHVMVSDKHCNTLKCSRCGGDMRRADRPGPGQPTSFSAQIALELYKESELKKAREVQKARSQQYGISVVKDGNVTKPDEYVNIPDSQFSDPVNYRYPIDRPHIRPTVSYFNHEEQRVAGGYSENDWAIIGNRIANAAGSGYTYEKEQITTPAQKETEKTNGKTKIMTITYKDTKIILRS